MDFVEQQLRYSEGRMSGPQLEEKRLRAWRPGNAGGLTEAWGFPRALTGLEGWLVLLPLHARLSSGSSDTGERASLPIVTQLRGHTWPLLQRSIYQK